MYDSFIKFHKVDIEQSIPTRFEQQVERCPKAIAIKEKNLAVTYTELNRRANHLAWAILDFLGHRSEPIVLFLDQGYLLITAILGTLKAGKFYVPLDPLAPPPRSASVLAETQTHLIITSSTYSSLAHQLAGDNQRVLNIEISETHFQADNPSLSLGPDSLAYIYFTSGSTGRPKGVVDNHRNVLHNVMRYTNSLRISSGDRLSLLQAPHFSGTVSSLFGALLNGAAICPYNLSKEGTDGLVSWLNKMEISIYHSVPVIFRSFLRHANQFPSIRFIRLEGDRASRNDIKLYHQYFSPTCVLVNGLGTTETGLCRQYFINKESIVTDNILPIGYPVEDMEIMLLDDGGQEVDTNQTGEIVVKSCFLSLGYWQEPELTQASFLPDPLGGEARFYRTGDLGRLRSDGCLEYLGRKDFQIKVSGQKVEPAEIEKALLDINFISEAVISTLDNKQGEAQIIAYLACFPEAKPSVVAIRQLLSKRLPYALIPTEYVFLKNLPVTSDGKINRLGLPEPKFVKYVSAKNYLAPQTFVERTIAGIWAEVFDLDRVGINDDFFELGGDSISAMQILSRLRRELSVDISIKMLFENTLLKDLADRIER
jgi:amino acid adenylation domain-containing protein